MNYQSMYDAEQRRAGKVYLQLVGWQNGIKAEDVNVGMRRFYNGGVSHEIVDIIQVSKQFLSMTVKSSCGKLYTSRVKKSTYIVAGY